MTLQELKCTASISDNLSILNYNFDLIEDAVNGSVLATDLAAVAFSGYYSDLLGTPDVEGFITEDEAQALINSAIATIYTYKGVAANAAALPVSGTAGDVYYLTDPGKSVAWDGSQWTDITMPVTLDDYVKDSDIIPITTSEIESLFPSN